MKPKMKLEWDKKMNLVLFVQCLECSQQIEMNIFDLKPGDQIQCSCGRFSYVITGDDIASTRDGTDLDESPRTFKKR